MTDADRYDHNVGGSGVGVGVGVGAGTADAFAAAAQEAGIPATEEFKRGSIEGVGVEVILRTRGRHDGACAAGQGADRPRIPAAAQRVDAHGALATGRLHAVFGGAGRTSNIRCSRRRSTSSTSRGIAATPAPPTSAT